MHLTFVRRAHSLEYLVKDLRRRKGVIRIAQGSVPTFIDKVGLPVIDPVEALKPAPRFPPWEPPVKDDPRFYTPSIYDHPDYHETPVYEYHEKAHLVEGQRQAEVLTKTHVIEGLPNQVNNNIGVVHIPRQDEFVQRYIMQANIWNPTKIKVGRPRLPETPKGWKYKAEIGIPRRLTNDILMQNMIRLCQTLDGADQELYYSRRVSKYHHMSTKHNFAEDKTILIHAKHHVMLSSFQPLPPFALSDEVIQTADTMLPDLYPIEPTIDIMKTNVYRDDDNKGWLEDSSKIYPHTVLHNYRDNWKLTNRNAKALMFAFANCMVVARAKYGADVKVLPEPVCTQWVGFADDTLNFMCYQLNTLDFTSQDGIKNIAWMDSNNKLYEKIVPKRAMLRNTKYEDYDPEVFAKFLAFYLTGVDPHQVHYNLKDLLEK